MKLYVFVVVCLEIHDGAKWSQAIQLYLRYFLNQALDLDTYTLSTAYTHIFSFSFTHCAAGKQIFRPESHFIRLNTGKEQKWSELVFMHIEGNRCLDRLPAQILYVIIIIYLPLT